MATNYRRVLGLFAATRRLGVGWLWYRLRKLAADKSGLTRLRLPEVTFDAVALDSISEVQTWRDAEHFFAFRGERSIQFLFERIPTANFATWAGEPTRAEWERRLEDLLAGRFVYFSDKQVEMGCPPDWFQNPFFNRRGPHTGHFSQLDEFHFGDVKAIWELSRFSFVFHLLRIYSRTKDERCSQLFWRLVDDWCQRNPGNVGINWKCGQETALRAIAITFGVWAFGKSPGVSAERLTTISRLMHVSGMRIEKYFSYAIRQCNNHSISEAAGLWMIGVLYPELKRAPHWRQLGWKALDEQIIRLFFDDGGFVQYSANYHRLAIQIITFCVALGGKNGECFSARAMARYRQAVHFMQRWVDPVSGLAPRYGNDDGSLVLPLSNAAYDDFRPALQSSSAIGLGKVPFPAGAWDEERFWLGQALAEAPHEPISAEHFVAGQGGLSVLAGDHSHLAFRCGLSRHRPAHLDAFHVDLWSDGTNLAIDPGTFSYNGQGKYAGVPLALSRYHNSVLINDREPAKQLGPFLFDRWPQSKLAHFGSSKSGRSSLLQGYRTDRTVASGEVIHRRAIGQFPGDFWLIIDQIDCPSPVATRLHWLIDSRFCRNTNLNRWELADHAQAWMLQIESSTPKSTMNEKMGCEQTPRGWFANRYLSCRPALSLETNAPPTTKALFVSIFCPVQAAAAGYLSVTFSDDDLRIESEQLQILVAVRPQSEILIQNVKSIGLFSEEIET